MKVDNIKHFGPSIAKVKIPNDILNNLNQYIDQIIINEQKSKSQNMGTELVGDVSQEFRLEKEFMTKSGWVNFLANATREWIEVDTGKKISNFELIDSWVVRQFKNEYNPIHWHTGHVSGAGWLKIPDNFGQTAKNKKNNPNGKINFIHGSKQFLSNPRTEINPVVGDMCIFPHYLMHEVYPFNSEGERRSISFNAFIDDEIFNTSQLKIA